MNVDVKVQIEIDLRAEVSASGWGDLSNAQWIQNLVTSNETYNHTTIL